jgi:hypothetical protein
MAAAGYPIQHNTLDGNIGIEMKTSQQQRRHGAGRLGTVKAKHHRQPYQLAEGCGAGGTFDVDPIKEATITFDNGNA